MLSNLILLEEKAKKAILVPIMISRENEIKMYIEEEKKWENMLFLKSKKHHKRIVFYKYFISLINFLSDLCYQRNYLAIDILSSYYPLELCLKIITNDSYHFDIRESFCTLTRNLWINVSPYNEINYPNKIKIWEEMKDGVYFSYYIGNITGFDELKIFIPDFIEYYLTKDILKDEGELELLKSILETLL